ncbi:MAG TPA: hypothetical protein VFJ72_12055 [Rubrobacteraceae bacterium]|nr:hypothetical protein [Rubrobacteraceae bacterium]
MSNSIPLRRPRAEVGDRYEQRASFTVPAFDLYGRHHEIENAEADVAVTRLAEGLHLDLEVRVVLSTTCDRTLEPTEVELLFGESEFLPGPNNRELCIREWELDLVGYTERALPSEVPMQVFHPGTTAVRPEESAEETDPRWRGLGGLFASGF